MALYSASKFAFLLEKTQGFLGSWFLLASKLLRNLFTEYLCPSLGLVLRDDDNALLRVR